MNGTDPAMPMLTHLTTQTQQDKTQPRHSDGFTMISPIESRRSKLHMMVQKEEENIQRSEYCEARERHLVELSQAKLQKQLRKEEMNRQRRQAEEKEYERMKAKQQENVREC
ncbi:epithelial-stromal interaction protein 1-like isoform X3 [Oncorhynchus keta]|uniref:epithelial-stromal interaction protein 1-like isoform X3 n=1 Tax=Oncorhynchus keta TaxID=8018 RepID=UPI0015FD0091|nr:epithelial-stromal interaction protein 1-like isoform X3 [Oncorhynchus keta]